MPPSHPRTRPRTRFSVAMIALGVVALIGLPAGPAAAQPTRIKNAGAAHAIKGAYIVVFKDGSVAKSQVPAVTDRLAGKHQATVHFRYAAALRGFSARMSPTQAEKLAGDPSVAYVEQDREVTIAATQSSTPTWGLDRLDRRDLPLNTTYAYPNGGAGVTVYVIDTGIRTTHGEFGGRAVWGTNTVDSTNSDCNGHGTHVAGTVGGKTYGVAKAVKLVAVKVLDCQGSGTFSAVAAGVDWVTAHHTSGPAVASMSLTGEGSDPAAETAVRHSIADGITYTIASGNSGADACDYTPARVTEAITVNATTRTDARAAYSNYGTCTDIFAPGDAITSTWNTSNTATRLSSGTSMATPHVAGAAAIILAANPSYTPGQVAQILLSNGSTGRVSDPGPGTPDRLLYVNQLNPALPPDCAARSNGTDRAIPDPGTVSSSITITGCAGRASATATIKVLIRHPYRGDLVVALVNPAGKIYTLHNRTGDGNDDLDAVYTRDLATANANGTWLLRVTDDAAQDAGSIDSWTLDL